MKTKITLKKYCLKRAVIILLLAVSPYCLKLSAQVTAIGTPALATATNTLSNFTAPAGTNRLLIVTASDAATTDITNVTYNGVTMIQSAEVTDGIAVDAIFTLVLGTNAGSTTGSIVVSSLSADHASKCITARVFEKVNQTTPLSGLMSAKNSITPSSSTLNILSNSGDLVFDLFDSWKSTNSGSSHSAGSGQTIMHTVTALPLTLGGNGWWTTSTRAGASSVSMSRSTTDHLALIHIAANIKNDNVVLPVTLKSFNATLINNEAKLIWKTVSEINFDHFEIEKSINGEVFNLIGKVFSKNKETESNYQYTDLDVSFGQQYYRLKIVDKDGAFYYSSIVALKTATSTALSLKVFPNPSSSTIIINHPKSALGSSIKIVSLDGKVVSSFLVDEDTFQTNVSVESLNRSNYLIVFENKGKILSTKFVKQ